MEKHENQKPVFKFKDFRRRMTNKMFLEEVNPGNFVRNPKFGIKNNFWVSEQYKKLMNSVLGCVTISRSKQNQKTFLINKTCPNKSLDPFNICLKRKTISTV